MIRVFRHYVPVPFILLGFVENFVLLAAVYAGFYARYTDISYSVGDVARHLPQALVFTSAVLVMMFAVGLYRREQNATLRTILVRLLTSFVLALLVLAMVFYVVPDLEIWRSALAIALVLGVGGLVGVRIVFLRVCEHAAFKRRVLVLGAGPRAANIERLADARTAAGFGLLGFVPAHETAPRVDAGRLITGVNALADLVRGRGAEEVVVAVEDRRTALPVEALLECKLNGVTVLDYATFWERETGRVDLDALQPSWLIFSDGFVNGRLRGVLKRAFDVAASLAVLVFTLPLLAAAAAAVKLDSPGPVFYRQARVGLGGRPFRLLKFRSMRADAEKDGMPRWAAVNDPRITAVGALLRKTRIDEIPQIFNVLKGDMSFVGPRPERPYFVDRLAAELPYYAERHRVKPGITGWAQLNAPYGASVADAKAKLEYDLYYVKNHSVFLDLIILMQTARVVLWPEGVR